MAGSRWRMYGGVWYPVLMYDDVRVERGKNDWGPEKLRIFYGNIRAATCQISVIDPDIYIY